MTKCCAFVAHFSFRGSSLLGHSPFFLPPPPPTEKLEVLRLRFARFSASASLRMTGSGERAPRQGAWKGKGGHLAMPAFS
jgi:hypothetical protein